MAEVVLVLTSFWILLPWQWHDLTMHTIFSHTLQYLIRIQDILFKHNLMMIFMTMMMMMMIFMTMLWDVQLDFLAPGKFLNRKLESLSSICSEHETVKTHLDDDVFEYWNLKYNFDLYMILFDTRRDRSKIIVRVAWVDQGWSGWL